MSRPHNHPFHDRLDKKLHAKNFTAPECGAINLETGKPEYCEFECPMVSLRGTEEHPKPHWITNPALVANREAELVKANSQPSEKPSENVSGRSIEGLPSTK